MLESLKCCIMLHMYLATEVYFYFNIAVYVWLQMTFKEKTKSDPSLGHPMLYLGT